MIKRRKIIYIKREICGKECNGLIGFSSHISQSKNHIDYKSYIKKYPIDRYIFKQMEKIFFKSFKENSNGCWLWEGTIDCYGYGKLYAFGKRVSAHRFSYELFNGKILQNLCVCRRR